MDKVITAILGFIGAYFVFRQNDKGNQLKYITEERAKWRQKIRKLSVEFMTSELYENGAELINPNRKKLLKIREQIAVRLNPNDDEDNYILCLMDKYINIKNNRDSIRNDLSIAFASLLKHDWERVKNEAKMESNTTKLVLLLISISIVTFLLTCLNWIPEKINLFTCKFSYKNNILFSNLYIWKTIFYILIILLIYKSLKYLKWRRQFRKENYLCYFFKTKEIKKTMYDCICSEKQKTDIKCNDIWNKYLGYTIRTKLSKK
jgi:hypothetical protein